MRELDINPLVADERGVVAVDVRVALHTPPRALARYDHLASAPYPSEFSADGKVGEFALVVADAWQGRGVGPHSCTRSRTALEHKACSASMARFSP